MMNSYQTELPAGSHWSLMMRRGTALTLTDVAGGVNAGVLFYNPENLLERYNAPDTLKCQHTFRLTAGHCLYSDMGRIFCGIEHDSFGWHETVCGTANAALIGHQFGTSDYQQARNDRHQNGYDSFLVELAKYGLGKRDMAACLNLFAHVAADEDGKLALVRQGEAGASVTLRFAMDTLVILHTCPHPLSRATAYPRQPLGIHIDGERKPLSALCLERAENQRGLCNNHLYHLSEGACSC
ncbi:urea amidolyase associated protein UAAP1 [Atlantibacter hermannii]|uniref:urea amidolyase associated protein UAAP1 n=1 Tax=Atlantibacter hermannii TaxID=565 RepID=UPI00289CB682|nr:urea amidolyase associated protein UAAP1 [Atlantibacter hermannii]